MGIVYVRLVGVIYTSCASALLILRRRFSYTYGRRKALGKPKIPKFWQMEDAFLGSSDSPEYLWFQWPRHLFRHRSYYREVFDAECYLVELAEDILAFLYPNQGTSTSINAAKDETVQLYARLCNWKRWYSDAIPQEAHELPQTLHVS